MYPQCYHLVSLRGRRLRKVREKCEGRARSAPRVSRFPRAQNPLSLPFQTPATQAITLLLPTDRHTLTELP